MISNKNFCHYPLSADWILLPSHIIFNDDGFHLLSSRNGFNLFSTQLPTKEDNKSTFVFGKIMPKIQGGDIELKGYYNLINFNDKSVEIFNDYLGVAKFFYSGGTFPVAASRLDLVHKVIRARFITENALLYLLFNYNVFGTTFFEDIYYSEPATKISIHENKLKKTCYRNDFKPVKEQNEKEAIKKLAQLWTDIISGSSKDKNLRTALTLTGGYDSRLILAGLLFNNVRPQTFTFGNSKSADTLAAAKVSNAFSLPHKAIKFDYCSSEILVEEMSELLISSGGLLNPFRNLRIKAICEMYKDADLLYLGYGGSEILRGIFPDGLLVSDFYGSYIKTRDCSKEVIKNFLGKFKLSVDDSIYERVSEIIKRNSEILGQYSYMTQVILPMHFGEDLRYLLRKGFDCYAPFMDEDFFMGALKLNLVPLYNENNSDNVKESHFNRIDNPKVSALLLSFIYKKLMKIELNRGYSPGDYMFSKYYAGMRLILQKYLKKKASPVTELNPWLNNFFKNNTIGNTPHILSDATRLNEALIKKIPKTEYDFIPWIRLWCIGTFLKIIKNTEKV